MQQNDREGHEVESHDSMGHSAFSDRLVWQQLVDNRLSDEEYRDLLLDLETKPGLWRECALAFLEDQALKQALAGWRPGDRGYSRTGPQFEVSNDVPPVAASASAGGFDVRLPAAPGSMRSPVPGLSAAGWSQPLLVTVSLAAGFLLAVFAFSQRFVDIGGAAAESQLGVTGVTPAVPVGEPLLMDRESFKDFLADLPPDQRRELFQRPTQQRVSPTVVARPASLGPASLMSGQVEAERRFLFYRMADGGTIVVPVDDYRFVAQEFQ